MTCVSYKNLVRITLSSCTAFTLCTLLYPLVLGVSLFTFRGNSITSYFSISQIVTSTNWFLWSLNNNSVVNPLSWSVINHLLPQIFQRYVSTKNPFYHIIKLYPYSKITLRQVQFNYLLNRKYGVLYTSRVVSRPCVSIYPPQHFFHFWVCLI